MSGHQSLQERQRQVREEAILDAARELLVEQGYAAMSMDDLAGRVGVSKATLYHHFPSKEELVVNVVHQSMCQGEEELRSAYLGRPAIDRLEHLLRHGIARRAPFWTARVTLPPQVKRHPLFQAQLEKMLVAWSALVDQAKAEGDIVGHIPTAVIVRTITSVFRDDYELLLTDAGLSAAELGALLVEIMFRGVRTGRPAGADERTSPAVGA